MRLRDPAVSGCEPNSIGWLHAAFLASVPLILWFGLISKLITDWSTNSQYEFGYFVPLFIAYLLGRRWVTRPEQEALNIRWIVAAAGLFILAIMLPLRIIQEANPDWRPLNWLHSTLVVGVTLVPFALVGGWRWVRHFSIPLLLIFTALPWPLATEQAVLQGLGRAVTTVTVEMLNIVNIPALQRGSVIDIPTGSVGVEDACSGIRSLAGTIMASLFFGEFYRLGYWRRFALLFCGCCLSFLLNLCRAFFLSWRAAIEGTESVSKWHDPAGFVIFALAFGGLWLLASFMWRSEPDPSIMAQHEVKASPIPYRWITFCLLWVISIEILRESWYRVREKDRSESVVWNIRWPKENESFRFKEIPPETRSILRYSSGKSAEFVWEDGTAWLMFFFDWAPGRSSIQLATMHRPEVCLPAVGYKYVQDAAPYQLNVAAIELPFSGTIFDSGGNTVYVYRCLWEDFPIKDLASSRGLDMSLKGRILGAWYGRRNMGQRMLQVAMLGMRNEREAREQLGQRLMQLVESKG